MIRSLFSTVVLALATIAGSLASIALWPVQRTGEPVMALARLWARVVLAAAGVRLEVTMHKAPEPGRPYVFMANHLSMVDIWAVLAAVPASYRFIAKKQLGWIPLFGWAMRSGQFIFIDRQNPLAARRSIQEAARRIGAGTSVLLFPEGTRSRDGRLGPFKKGGFHLAIGSQVPIVPIAIKGAREIMPRGSARLRAGTVRVEIGEPVATAGLTEADRDELARRIRGLIAGMLGDEPAT